MPLRSVLLLAAAEQPLPGAELRPFRAKRSLPRKVLRINPERAVRAPGAGFEGTPLVWRLRGRAAVRLRGAERHCLLRLAAGKSPYFLCLLKVTVGHVWERGAAQGSGSVSVGLPVPTWCKRREGTMKRQRDRRCTPVPESPQRAPRRSFCELKAKE